MLSEPSRRALRTPHCNCHRPCICDQPPSSTHTCRAIAHLTCQQTFQVVVTKEVYDISKFSTGCSVMIRGKVVAAPEAAKQDIEFEAAEVLWFGPCDSKSARCRRSPARRSASARSTGSRTWCSRPSCWHRCPRYASSSSGTCSTAAPACRPASDRRRPNRPPPADHRPA